jgi:hypothetical protein
VASGSTARLLVEIAGDSSGAVKAFKQTSQASGEAEGAAKKTGLSLGGIAKAVATGYAVTKVVEFGKKTVEAAYESQQAHDRLVAVFKGVGDSQGTAAAAAEKYAGSLSKQTGVDDELIMKGQAILATFHSVSGETGRTAGIFDRATAAGADLAAAGFGSIESNAVQLGKALEDPTKGMTALAKSGVTFTAEQKKAIAQMQKSGDLLGAQKIVLKGVEDQVKGTAEATATNAAKMNVAWGNAQESIGAVLLPAIESISGKLSGVFDFVSANSSWLVPLIGSIIGLATAFMIISKAIAVFQTALGVAKIAVAGFKLVWAALNSSFLASPIGLIVIAIVALIAIIVLIATKTTWFQQIWAALTSFMTAAWRATTSAITGAFNATWGFISGVFNSIRNIASSVFGWIRSNWPLLLGILTGPFGLAIALVYTFRSQILGALSSLVGAIAGIFSGVVGAITAPFRSAFAIVKGIVDAALAGIRGAVSGVMSFVSGGISTAKSTYNAFARTWNAIQIGFPGIDKGPIHIGGFTVGLPDLPMLQAGGLMTRSGLIYAHVGEVISPAPASSARAPRGPALVIESATFTQEVDVEVLMRKVSWALQTARI